MNPGAACGAHGVDGPDKKSCSFEACIPGWEQPGVLAALLAAVLEEETIFRNEDGVKWRIQRGVLLIQNPEVEGDELPGRTIGSATLSKTHSGSALATATLPEGC